MKQKYISSNLFSYYYLENDGSKTRFIINTSGGVVEVKQIPNSK